MAALIRIATADDAAAIAAIYRPYVEHSRISFEDIAPDAAEMARRMSADRGGLYPWLIAEHGNEVIGYTASSPFRTRSAYRWTVETGVYLRQDAQGHGVGRALLSRLLEVLTQQRFATAIGAIALPNDASVALHEKLGFVRSGTYRQVGYKFGQWVDVGLWQRELAERAADPDEPLPYAGLSLSW